MRPNNLKTKIFLDSGDPAETKEALKLLGFLDGQTTNPSLFAKNPAVIARINEGKKFSREEIYTFYKDIILEISSLIPDGSVSVEVYADSETFSGEMVSDAIKMNGWIRNAHIKLPITAEGLKAADLVTKEGIRINMTLCFIQEQAAAVYAATVGGDDIFVSPFIGRLDDRGDDGMDLVKNIVQMYRDSDHHVKVLAASVRTYDHFLYSLQLGSDIVTAPLKVIREWIEKGMTIPDENYQYYAKDLKPIEYKQLNLNDDYQSFPIANPLLDAGLTKFADDWNKLIG